MSYEPKQIPKKRKLTLKELRWEAAKGLIITFYEFGLHLGLDARGFHITEFISRYENKYAK